MNNMDEFKEQLRKRILEGLGDLGDYAAMRADDYIVKKNLMDTGNMRRFRDIDLNTEELTFTLVYRMPYAKWIEFGTEPHPVSFEGMQKIAEWCRHKLGKTEKESIRMSRAIAWKIYHEGSDPHPFVRPALADAKIEARRIFEEALNRR